MSALTDGEDAEILAADPVEHAKLEAWWTDDLNEAQRERWIGVRKFGGLTEAIDELMPTLPYDRLPNVTMNWIWKSFGGDSGTWHLGAILRGFLKTKTGTPENPGPGAAV